MRINGYRKYLKKRGQDSKGIAFSVNAVKDFDEYLKKNNGKMESATVNMLKKYVSNLIKEGKNSEDRLIAIARYSYYTKKNCLYAYLASILGAAKVPHEISKRLGSIAGEEIRQSVYQGIEFPPLGSPQDDYPEVTKKIIERMEAELPPAKCREIMTWNYHKVPATVFEECKKRFEKSNNIDEYLKEEHKRLVNELESCMKKGRLWFEQEITPEVLEFVKNNQEINTGIRRGDRIFKTKIPYAPKQFLKEKDPIMRRYYSCHCQLVRTAILKGKPQISPTFCYCSAGYEKIHFDVIFEQIVEVELLESILKGDSCCRFAIKIPKGKMKK
ncbi:MAG: DUF6144 family protein [Candidatus Bathyarchaeota archaeon]|nr:DUF6144 family protein [Candidatus Bathyarchaeota archaeon]